MLKLCQEQSDSLAATSVAYVNFGWAMPVMDNHISDLALKFV